MHMVFQICMQKDQNYPIVEEDRKNLTLSQIPDGGGKAFSGQQPGTDREPDQDLVPEPPLQDQEDCQPQRATAETGLLFGENGHGQLLVVLHVTDLCPLQKKFKFCKFSTYVHRCFFLSATVCCGSPPPLTRQRCCGATATTTTG